MGKRLKKEHFEVLIKVCLNKGHNKNSEILSEHEMRIFNELVEAGYVEIVNRSYSYITPMGRNVEKVIENCLSTMESMYELGYVTDNNHHL